MAFALVFADFVFLSGVDVGVVIEDGGADAVLQHPFHDGRRAGGATGVEQHFVQSFGYLNAVLFLHVS